ncbi:neuropilin and tolloid protein 2 like [Trichuris trichiura]|uniref:Neuropilin and tolloid protein 2 like n=1 Tax=Trichuris trichiura TaxID=36087 RepID=A0A077ZFB5_TRITR|nr:neuropilin and tolloid protein 2 like [Trichuris trichiura]
MPADLLHWIFTTCYSWQISLYSLLLFSPLILANWEYMESSAELSPSALACSDFTGTNSTHADTFTSPNYPLPYPPNLMCLRKICAAPGYAIFLDFRGGFFEIESAYSPKSCPFDFLEVRNGPYGFSPLLGRFCGFSFPPLINADSGCVWLQFRSDETLQGRGFMAVHHFVRTSGMQRSLFSGLHVSILFRRHSEYDKGPTDNNRVGSQLGIIQTQEMVRNVTKTARDEVECVWKIKGQTSLHKLRLAFSVFNLAYPNECELNFLEIYETHTDSSHMVKRLCGTSASEMELSTHVVFIRLHLSRVSVADTEIEIEYYTYLRNSLCVGEYFSCGDGTCIPKALLCNGRSDCASDIDENNCVQESAYKLRFTSSPYLAVFVAFMAILTLISLGSMYWYFVKHHPPTRKQKSSFQSNHTDIHGISSAELTELTPLACNSRREPLNIGRFSPDHIVAYRRSSPNEIDKHFENPNQPHDYASRGPKLQVSFSGVSEVWNLQEKEEEKRLNSSDHSEQESLGRRYSSPKENTDIDSNDMLTKVLMPESSLLQGAFIVPSITLSTFRAPDAAGGLTKSESNNRTTSEVSTFDSNCPRVESTTEHSLKKGAREVTV